MAKKKQENALITEAQVVVSEVTEQQALAQVWERRLVNPLMTPSVHIMLKQPGSVLRWIDTGRSGRFHRATRDQGWTPVRPEELSDPINDLGLQDQRDGRVRQGTRGQEVLCKMPESMFLRIRQRKSDLVNRTLKRTKQTLAHAAAQRFGTEEAADFVMGKGDVEKTGISGLKGDILDTPNEITLD